MFVTFLVVGINCYLSLYFLQSEFGWAVTKMLFLESRKSNSASGGANLVSCGGNGWVRFWNSTHNTLLAEFVAHAQCKYRYLAAIFRIKEE